MQNYFGYKCPCNCCPHECFSGAYCRGRNCERWQIWFKKVWPRLCRAVKARAERPREREKFRYYHPDEPRRDNDG